MSIFCASLLSAGYSVEISFSTSSLMELSYCFMFEIREALDNGLFSIDFSVGGYQSFRLRVSLAFFRLGLRPNSEIGCGTRSSLDCLFMGKLLDDIK
jgi:hypothetical protein